MTLIDTNSLHNAAFVLGTVLFVGILVWSVWFAFHMD
ncbi:delta-aminolevulinic acid dehydratase [Synechocystis sp. PCC 6803]|nr:delta-aminolevulinic acid dehydratase [Synechocystis sp. IPPAS B-1465]MCW5239169.1 delta-aminolevulinic acid dehydratase [Synechocystis sp. PCC 6803]